MATKKKTTKRKATKKKATKRKATKKKATKKKAAKKKAPKKKATKASTARKTIGVRAAQKEAQWQELVGDKADATFRRYDIGTTFKEGDCIDHPKFGPGAVISLNPPQKITVIFRDGERLLVHDRS